MTYNKVIETLCRMAIELKEKGDKDNALKLEQCVIVLDNIQMRVNIEINNIVNILKTED
jgi:hypothetical protein